MNEDERAAAELDLCEQAFDEWLIEMGYEDDPEPLRILQQQAWMRAWAAGYDRGLDRALLCVRKTIRNL